MPTGVMEQGARVTESILVRTARGAGWVLGWRVTTRLLGLVNTLILVRLLVPGDFGLLALGVGFAKAIEGLSEIGVEDALVRARDPSRALYDTGFTVNLIRGLLGAAIIAGGAWPIAVFFDEPALFPVLLALTAGLLITSLENIGIVDFRRHMTFEREFQLLVLPRIASILVTLACAMTWRSHWALVAGMLTGQTLRVGMTYVMHPFRPRLSLAAWGELASFSIWSWAVSLTVLVRDRIDSFAIGRIQGATAVGVFTVAQEVASIPTYEIAAPLGRAALSGFAVERDAEGAAEALYPRILASIVALGLPAGFGISLVADQVVHIALGPQWTPAIEPIRILGVAGTGWLFSIVTVSYLTAHGALRPLVVVGVVSIVVRLLAVIALLSWLGLSGAAWGAAIGMAVEHLSCVWLACRRFRFSVPDLARRVWRPILAALVMTCGLVWLDLGWTTLPPDGTGAVAALIGAIGIGALTYCATLGLAWLACGRPAGVEADLITLIRRTVTGRSASAG
jgi:O-antigen/teichoic acid export membrane protein